MNKRYIKLNNDKRIIDVFYPHQKSKFDGTEIFLDETEKIEHKINGKSISDEYGNFIFEYKDGIITEVNLNEYLDEYKSHKRKEIKDAFGNEFTEGTFVSPSLGFEIDLRRVGIKNDLQNAKELLGYMERHSQIEIDYVGAKNKKKINKSQLEALVIEMSEEGLARYQKKWGLLDQIEACTTIEELNQISW